MSSNMPIEIEGVEYFTAADIHRALGIARQTLWRWRTARKIPQGRRYRDKKIVFTLQELEAIREYANRLEPADSPQLRPASGVPAAGPKGDT
jgi:predicted DNA-binding protein (UPF0251 family)